MSVLTASVSLDQFYATETKPATELVDGELVQKPMPTNFHSDIQGWLCYSITLALGGQRHRVRSEQNLQLSEKTVLVPDVCVLRQPDNKSGRAQTVPPLLCVEIISPSDRFSKTTQKCQRYLDWGVSVCWILNPADRRAWIIDASGTTEVGEDGLLVADSIALPLSEVFAA